MLYYLNRYRGTWSWFAKVVAIFFALLFGLVTMNPYIGFFVGVGYLLGESFGWGDWRGGILTGNHKCGDEGEKNGIKWLASKFYECGTREYDYLALFIRGLYWWIPAFFPLYFIIDQFYLTGIIIALSATLPYSDYLASKLDPTKYDTWAESEKYQGFFQDIAAILLITYILIIN